MQEIQKAIVRAGDKLDWGGSSKLMCRADGAGELLERGIVRCGRDVSATARGNSGLQEALLLTGEASSAKSSGAQNARLAVAKRELAPALHNTAGIDSNFETQTIL